MSDKFRITKTYNNLDKKVIIVGCGISGICTAIKLLQAGIDNFVIVEKSSECGGTWYNK